MEYQELLTFNFTKLFEQTGLTQSQFAQLTESHQPTISKILYGKKQVPERHIELIKNKLNVDISSNNMSLDSIVTPKFETQKITTSREYRIKSDTARDNIIKLYNNSGLGVTRFAKGVGVSPSTINKVIKENEYPSKYLIDSIKNKLGVNLEGEQIGSINVNTPSKIKRLFVELYEMTNLSKSDFCRSLEVDPSLLTKIQHTTRGISQNIINKVQEVYGINLLTVDSINLKDSDRYRPESEIRDEFIKIYMTYLSRKKEFRYIIGKNNYHNVFQIVNKNKPVPKSIIENIRKNLGISIDRYSDELIGAGNESAQFVFLLNNNTLPLVVSSEAEAKNRYKELQIEGIKFKLYKEIKL